MGTMFAPSDVKTCPQCAEEIGPEAILCGYCGAHFDVVYSGYCTHCHDRVNAAPDHSTCTRCGGRLIDLVLDSTYLAPAYPRPMTPASMPAPMPASMPASMPTSAPAAMPPAPRDGETQAGLLDGVALPGLREAKPLEQPLEQPLGPAVQPPAVSTASRAADAVEPARPVAGPEPQAEAAAAPAAEEEQVRQAARDETERADQPHELPVEAAAGTESALGPADVESEAIWKGLAWGPILLVAAGVLVVAALVLLGVSML